MKLGHTEIRERWRMLGRRWFGGLVQGLGLGLMIGGGIGISIHDQTWTFALNDGLWANVFLFFALGLATVGGVITGVPKLRAWNLIVIASVWILGMGILGGVFAYAYKLGPEVPLAHACSAGDLARVAMILDQNPALLKTHPYGTTPLHFAAASGRLNIVKYLVDQGADVRAVNLNWQTPEDVARANHQNETVEYLDKHKALGNGTPGSLTATLR